MKFLLLYLWIPGILSAQKKINSYSVMKSCNVGELAEEIASYESVVEDIIDFVTTGPFKGKTYDEWVPFCIDMGFDYDFVPWSIIYCVTISPLI